jgi:hypothetical protein
MSAPAFFLILAKYRQNEKFKTKLRIEKAIFEFLSRQK